MYQLLRFHGDNDPCERTDTQDSHDEIDGSFRKCVKGPKNV